MILIIHSFDKEFMIMFFVAFKSFHPSNIFILKLIFGRLMKNRSTQARFDKGIQIFGLTRCMVIFCHLVNNNYFAFRKTAGISIQS